MSAPETAYSSRRAISNIFHVQHEEEEEVAWEQVNVPQSDDAFAENGSYTAEAAARIIDAFMRSPWARAFVRVIIGRTPADILESVTGYDIPRSPGRAAPTWLYMYAVSLFFALLAGSAVVWALSLGSEAFFMNSALIAIVANVIRGEANHRRGEDRVGTLAASLLFALLALQALLAHAVSINSIGDVMRANEACLSDTALVKLMVAKVESDRATFSDVLETLLACFCASLAYMAFDKWSSFKVKET